MKRAHYLQLLALMCGVGLLLNGCLIKPSRVQTRHFVLAPIPAPERGPAIAQRLAVEVGFVKMPSYLLRDSMIVRKSANEFEYLEDAIWAERLDQCFQRTLADDLSTLLLSNQVYTSASERNPVIVKVSVDVNQFDVDNQGQGTLSARWRLTLPDNERPVKSALIHLTQAGPSPLSKPQAIAMTLSALTAEFSQKLAQAIRESVTASP